MLKRSLLIAAGVLAGALSLPSEAQAGPGSRGRGGDRGRVAPVVERVHVAPARGHGRHGSDRHFRMRGRYVIQTYQVWVPGAYRQEYVPAYYREHRGPFGRVFRVMVRAGFTRSVWVPAHFETQTRRVWIPGPRFRRHR